MSRFNPNAASFTPKAKPAETTAPTSSTFSMPQVAAALPENGQAAPQEAEKPAQSPSPQAAPQAEKPAAPKEDGPKTEKTDSPAPAKASAPKAKGKPAEVVDEADTDLREHVNIVLLGHVDAGKSTISGHLLFQAGMVDARLLEKYEKEARDNSRASWSYAYVMDTNEDERARGKTVEVGRANFSTDKKKYTLLDAPGHRAYIPNMIGGASQADFGVLIISAKTGEFESGFEKGGQTGEHAVLAKTLGIKYLVIAINKMDEESVNWSQARYDHIKACLLPHLKKNGWTAEQMIFVPISGFQGYGLFKPIPEEICPWWKSGRYLVDILDNLPSVERNTQTALRASVSDKFKDQGMLYLLGKVESGIIRKGANLIIMPSKVPIKVLSLTNGDEEELDKLKAGDFMRIGTNGEENDVHPGYVVCDAAATKVPSVIEFEAQVAVIELPGNPLFCAGYNAVMHIHSLIKEVTVADLVMEIDKKTKKPAKKKPTFFKVGSQGTIRLQIPGGAVCLETFAESPQLGRFTLRDKGKTIVIGKVTKLTKVEKSV